jgi:hypothetical protein
MFDTNLTGAVWLIGFIAALYTAWGGLKRPSNGRIF